MTDWITWTPDYTVHVEQIDTQHKELFARLNSFLEAMWDGKGKEVLDKNLLFLADYTIEHFGTEETLMKQHNYPHYMAHKKLHDDFVQEVKEFIAKFESEDLGTDLVVAVGTKLGDWVREHVKRTDVQFGKFLASKRIKS